MSEHILVCSPVALQMRDAATGLLAERDGYSIWLRRFPETDPYYTRLSKAFSQEPTWSFFYALTDSPDSLHLEKLPERLVADAGVSDQLSDAAFDAFGEGLAEIVSAWPTPYALYISENPQQSEKNTVLITQANLALAIRAQTDSIFWLPDVLITVTG